MHMHTHGLASLVCCLGDLHAMQAGLSLHASQAARQAARQAGSQPGRQPRRQPHTPASPLLLPLLCLPAVGAGPYSQVVAVQTSRAPPSPPEGMEVQLAPGDAATSSGGIVVSWQVVQQGPHQAPAVSHEIEATAAGCPVVRHTCPARSTSAEVGRLQRGATYTVRMRSVGADGAGHGAWSDTVRIEVPQRADEAAAASLAGSSAAQDLPPSKLQKRQERGAGQQPRTAAAVKTVAAKGAPKKRGMSYFLEKKRLGVISIQAILGIFGAMIILVFLLNSLF